LSGENISDAGLLLPGVQAASASKPEIFKACTASCRTLFKMKGSPSWRFRLPNNPRLAGQSNYGIWNRLFASF